MTNIDEVLTALTIVFETKPGPRMGLSTLGADEEWRVECELQGKTDLPDLFYQEVMATNMFNILINFVKMLENGGFLKDAKTTIDAETIEALGLLRAHFRTPDLSVVKKFEGVRKEGVSALEYYDTHYADFKEAMNGRLLSQNDRKLYHGMNDELRREGRTISDIVPSYDSILEKRRNATAQLLGVSLSEYSEEQLYNFFTTIRHR